jgi:RNA polymerase sigma factor (sigma-70 family)
MANAAATLLEHIRQLASLGALAGLADQVLLRRYLECRDKAAFAMLLRRHGPMVWSAARRLLPQAPDADDVFQAAFLVLAREAKSLLKHPCLAGWLHETTCRLAKRARASAVRRSRHEGQVSARPPGDALAEITGRELLGVLDAELRRIPEKYRTPLVLSYLEGRSQDESARQVGCSVSTFKRRLERGRELLRSTLVRRGITFPAAFLTTALTESTGLAAVPARTAAVIVQAAIELAAGKATSATVSANVATLVDAAGTWVAVAKIKTAALVLAGLCVLGVGVGVLALKPSTRHPESLQRRETKRDAKKEAAKTEPKRAGTDLYGDDLPAGASARLGTLRWRINGQVGALAFAPDGKTVAVASQDQGLCLFDAASGKLKKNLGSSYDAFDACLAFSSDGTRLAHCGAVAKDGLRTPEVQIWNIAQERKTRVFDALKLSLHWFGWSADDHLLGVSTENGGILLRDLENGTTWRFTAKDLPERRLLTLAFSRRGNILAVADEQSLIHVWDISSGKERCTLQVERNVGGLAISNDGRTVASHAVSNDNGNTPVQCQYSYGTRSAAGPPISSRRASMILLLSPLPLTERRWQRSIAEVSASGMSPMVGTRVARRASIVLGNPSRFRPTARHSSQPKSTVASSIFGTSPAGR